MSIKPEDMLVLGDALALAKIVVLDLNTGIYLLKRCMMTMMPVFGPEVVCRRDVSYVKVLWLGYR